MAATTASPPTPEKPTSTDATPLSSPMSLCSSSVVSISPERHTPLPPLFSQSTPPASPLRALAAAEKQLPAIPTTPFAAVAVARQVLTPPSPVHSPQLRRSRLSRTQSGDNVLLRLDPAGGGALGGGGGGGGGGGVVVRENQVRHAVDGLDRAVLGSHQLLLSAPTERIVQTLRFEDIRQRRPVPSSLDTYTPPPAPVTCGLVNLGNTCFMAAAIQALCSIDYLVDFFLTDRYLCDLNLSSDTHGELAKAFAGLVRQLCTTPQSGAVAPRALKAQVERFAPQFAGYSQQDAQELLRCLLDGLADDTNRVAQRVRVVEPTDAEDRSLGSDAARADFAWCRYQARHQSTVAEVFAGQLASRVTCLACGAASVTYDTFWDLSLPLPVAGAANQPVSLAQCLDEFTRDEVLEDPEQLYFCSGCKSRQRAVKSVRIHRAPRVLVLHLKRFAYPAGGGGFGGAGRKVTSAVTFPVVDMDVTRWSTTTYECPSAYALVGMVRHVGSLHGGHYLATVRKTTTAEAKQVWMTANDTRVSVDRDVVGATVVESCEAYVVVYQAAAPAAAARKNKL
ncbi:Ubiquitin carboxyl-terminal hydrolase 2 [Sorochytrium milnesiophthora]